MNFKTEFIQICFCCSADFIQPSFHLFCDVVVSWLLSINRARLFLFFDLHCGVIYACTIYIANLHACTIYIAVVHACTIYIVDLHACTIYIVDLHACTIYLWIYMLVRFYIVLHCGVLDCMIYVHELKVKLLKSKFESCPVSSYSRA